MTGYLGLLVTLSYQLTINQLTRSIREKSSPDEGSSSSPPLRGAFSMATELSVGGLKKDSQVQLGIQSSSTQPHSFAAPTGSISTARRFSFSVGGSTKPPEHWFWYYIERKMIKAEICWLNISTLHMRVCGNKFSYAEEAQQHMSKRREHNIK